MTDNYMEKGKNYADKEEKEYEMGCKTSQAVAQDENSGHKNEQNESITINKNGK